MSSTRAIPDRGSRPHYRPGFVRKASERVPSDGSCPEEWPALLARTPIELIQTDTAGLWEAGTMAATHSRRSVEGRTVSRIGFRLCLSPMTILLYVLLFLIMLPISVAILIGSMVISSRIIGGIDFGDLRGVIYKSAGL